MCSFVLRSLFLSGVLLAAVLAAPMGPDGQPGSGAASLDGSGAAGSTGSGSPSVSGTASAGAPVPYDLKSSENPHWNSFLNEVASQTSRTLADLQANAASDPSIAVMWDVYVHSLGDGAALPSASTSLVPATGSGSSSGSGSQSPSPSTAELPNVNQNWFQSFFKNPTGTGANSFSQNSAPQYDTGLSTNNFGGSSGGSGGDSFSNQFGTAPSSSSGSMDQMFSRFRIPSSGGQTQMQMPQNQPMPNSQALAQQFYSLVSPSLMQSFMPQQSQPTQQSAPMPQAVRLPDTGWGGSGSAQQQAPPTQTPPPLSEAALQQLGDELLMLLGKTPADPVTTPPPPPPTPPPQPQPPAPQSQLPNFDLTNFTNSLAQSLTQSLSQSQSQGQSQSQPQPPPAPAPQPQPQTNTQPQLPQVVNQGGQIPSPSQMPAFPGLGTDVLNMPNNNVQLGADLGGAGLGLPPGNMGLPGLPPRSPLDPMLTLYNARFKAGASRDLGCRTLGEIIDMDVPRPLNLNCPRLCPAMLGRAMTGKRFGLTCLCCPVYVSDQAIGFRSMVRQAESLA